MDWNGEIRTALSIRKGAGGELGERLLKWFSLLANAKHKHSLVHFWLAHYDEIGDPVGSLVVWKKAGGRDSNW